jgi:hypothetical protein
MGLCSSGPLPSAWSSCSGAFRARASDAEPLLRPSREVKPGFGAVLLLSASSALAPHFFPHRLRPLFSSGARSDVEACSGLLSTSAFFRGADDADLHELAKHMEPVSSLTKLPSDAALLGGVAVVTAEGQLCYRADVFGEDRLVFSPSSPVRAKVRLRARLALCARNLTRPLKRSRASTPCRG